MRKPGRKAFERFLARFREESARLGKRQHIVPYLMSGHPGSNMADMLELALALKKLGMTEDDFHCDSSELSLPVNAQGFIDHPKQKPEDEDG